MSGETFSLEPDVNVHLWSFTRPGTALPDAKKIVLFHHGIGDHGGRYARVADALFEKCAAVDAVLSYDCRGHGRTVTNNKFCQVHGIDQLCRDFGNVLANHWLKVCNPEAKFMLAGRTFLHALALFATVPSIERLQVIKTTCRARIRYK